MAMNRGGGGEVPMEEGSRTSTSLEHWEAQSVDVHKTAIPVYEDEDDRGLSKAFRISIITGSLLIMLAVVLCLVVILPRSSSGQHNRKGLLEPVRAQLQGASSYTNGYNSGNGNSNKKKNNNNSKGIAMACRATRFRDACEASLASSQTALRALRSEDVIRAATQVAAKEVLKAYSLTLNLLADDDMETAQECKLFLSKANSWFSRCQSSSLSTEIKGIRSWMSAALTYQNDCYGRLSHQLSEGCTPQSSQLLVQIMQQLNYTFTLTSNALSMVYAYHTYGSDATTWRPPYRRSLLQDSNSDHDFHTTLSKEDRVLLSAPLTELLPDVIVSKTGLGNYTTVQAAVDAAPDNANRRYIIYIREGVYNETVKVPFSKTSLTFMGDGLYKTVITGNKNVMMPGVTTYNSATVAIEGDGFIARDMTFENTAGPDNHQAVALRVDSDLSAFHNCSILGYQDTLYAHSLRQFYRNCKIEGTIDFIFGDSASLFQNCHIFIRPGAPNITLSTVTAQGRIDPAEPTALVFQNCTVNGTAAYMRGLQENPAMHKAYLGRPWRLYSRTVFMQSYLEQLVHPDGWLNWDGTYALDTLFYGEYRNRGPGATSLSRVKWSNQITMGEALLFTVESFIQGDQWLPATEIPYYSLL